MHARKRQIEALEVLTKRADFLKIQQKGKKWTAHGLVLQVRENALGTLRVGFTVSKKIDKRAVVRNRIKRRLRSAAADVLGPYAQAGADYILVGRAKSVSRPYKSLCEDLKWCLRKTGFEKQTQKTSLTS